MMEHPIHLMTASDLYNQADGMDSELYWIERCFPDRHDEAAALLDRYSNAEDDGPVQDAMVQQFNDLTLALIDERGDSLIEVQTGEQCRSDHHRELCGDNDYRPMTVEEALQGARFARYRADGSGISPAALAVLEARKAGEPTP